MQSRMCVCDKGKEKRATYHLVEMPLFCLLQNVHKPLLIDHLDSAFSAANALKFLSHLCFTTRLASFFSVHFLPLRKRDGLLLSTAPVVVLGFETRWPWCRSSALSTLTPKRYQSSRIWWRLVQMLGCGASV